MNREFDNGFDEEEERLRSRSRKRDLGAGAGADSDTMPRGRTGGSGQEIRGAGQAGRAGSGRRIQAGNAGICRQGVSKDCIRWPRLRFGCRAQLRFRRPSALCRSGRRRAYCRYIGKERYGKHLRR